MCVYEIRVKPLPPKMDSTGYATDYDVVPGVASVPAARLVRSQTELVRHGHHYDLSPRNSGPATQQR